MRCGLIGFGSIGERHHRNLLMLGHDVVVLTQRHDVADVQTVATWKAFGSAGPYDAILITNETSKHLDTLKKSLGLRPKAVFLEKPFSHSVKGVAAMIAAYKKARIGLWVGYPLPFGRPLIEVKRILDSGRLGKIYSMRVSVGQDLRTWRKRDYRKSYSASRKQGGGVLLDLVHEINYPAWLLGESLRVKGAIVRKLSKLEISTEDFSEALLVSKSGVVVSVHQDYLRIPGRRMLEVMGEKGTLVWESATRRIALAVGTKKKELNVEADGNEMYVAELRAFFKQVKSKRFVGNAEEALQDLRVIEGIRNASK